MEKLRSDHARTKPVVVEKIKKRTQMKDYQQARALKEQRDIGRAKEGQVGGPPQLAALPCRSGTSPEGFWGWASTAEHRNGSEAATYRS